MKRKVTLRDLEKLGACYLQRELFQETFPDGAYITTENLAKAESVGLNVYWLISHAVEPSIKRTYRRHNNSLMDKYMRNQISTDELDKGEYAEQKVALKTGWKKPA